MLNNIEQDKIIINGKSFNIHPVYNLYASSEDGYIIHVVRRIPLKGFLNNAGYKSIYVRKCGEIYKKSFLFHNFVWECYNGIIPDDKVINHINNKEDNCLSNLQLVTQQQNYKKHNQNKRCVKALNCFTNEETCFNSMYAVQQHLGINVGLVKMACDGTNNVKSGISRVDFCRYKFSYIQKEDLPENFKKSANKRPKKK